MTEARLVVGPSSISFRRSGPATGDIVLMIDGTPFPMGGWNDFVVVIVEAWISALLQLLRGSSAIERVHFMEGPYAVDMGPLQSGSVRIRTFERTNREHMLVDVPCATLVESAIAAGEDVLKACESAQQRSRDSDRLAVTLDALRREVLSTRN
jgi:hypothetical protein